MVLLASFSKMVFNSGRRRTNLIGLLAASASPVVRCEKLKRDHRGTPTVVPLLFIFGSRNALFRTTHNGYFIPVGVAAIEKTWYVRMLWTTIGRCFTSSELEKFSREVLKCSKINSTAPGLERRVFGIRRWVFAFSLGLSTS